MEWYPGQLKRTSSVLRMILNDFAWSFSQGSGFLCFIRKQGSWTSTWRDFSLWGILNYSDFLAYFQRWLIPREITQMQIINLHDGPAQAGRTRGFLAVNLVAPTKGRKALEQDRSPVASLDAITPCTSAGPLHRWRFVFEGHWTPPISLMHHN